MGMPLQIERAKIFKRNPGCILSEFAALHKTSECLCHLDVKKMGYVETKRRISDSFRNGTPQFRAQ
jgi:hypothetical protein